MIPSNEDVFLITQNVLHTMDVLGEVTNMIGGNYKSQVPGPSYLSIPSVTTGQNFQFALKGARVISDMVIASASESINILICERE